MQDDESRVHETVKTVYPYEMGEGAICESVSAAVRADLAERFPSGHTGCLSTAVVEAIAADVYFDKKKEFENDRSGADVYLQNHAGNLPAFQVSACRWNDQRINVAAGRGWLKYNLNIVNSIYIT